MLAWIIETILNDLMVILPVSAIATIGLVVVIDRFNIEPLKSWLSEDD